MLSEEHNILDSLENIPLKFTYIESSIPLSYNLESLDTSPPFLISTFPIQSFL